MKKHVTISTILITALFGTLGFADGTHNMDGEELHHDHMGQLLNHNLIFPHITMGNGYQTKLTLMNPGQGLDVSGTLFFYNQDGTEASVNIGGELVSTYQISIPQGGFDSLILGNPEDQPQRVWAIFINDEETVTMGGSGMTMIMGDHLFGGVIYSRYQDGLATQVGTLGMQFMDGMQMGFALPVTNDDHNVTGLVILNSSDAVLPVEFTFKSMTGEVLFQVEQEFDPGQQRVDVVSAFVPEFDGIQDFHGVLELRSPQDGLVPLALVNTDGIQTAIPFVHIPDAMQGSGTPMN